MLRSLIENGAKIW